jgi:zinc finger CCHC domain-containing protein 8
LAWYLTYLSNTSRCFNCSSTEHSLASCPEHRDQLAVSAARAAYAAQKAEDGDDDDSPNFGGRFYDVQEWRQERLRWVDEFEVGKIKGSELREGLGLSEEPVRGEQEHMPWFCGERGAMGGMLMWGYPPGWFNEDGMFCNWFFSSET